MAPVTILLAGNCHAAYLSMALARSTGLNVALIGRGAYAFMLGVPEGRITYLGSPEATATYVGRMREAGSRVVLIEQMTPRQATVDSDVKALFAPQDTAHLIHAEIPAYFLHVYAGRDWRNDLAEGKLDRKIRRRFDIDKAAIASSVERAGFSPDFTDRLVAKHHDNILFHTENHPTDALLSLLFEPVLDRLEEVGGIDAAERRDIMQRLAHDQGISHVTAHPVHQSVGEALRLGWVEQPWYVDWSMAQDLMRARRYEDACDAAYSALQDHRCSQHVWALLGRLLELIGDQTRAHQAFGAAYRAFPVNTLYCRSWIGSVPGVDKEGALDVAHALRRSMRLWQRSQLADETLDAL